MSYVEYVKSHTIFDKQPLFDHHNARLIVHIDRIYIREKCGGYCTCRSVEPIEIYGECEILDVINMDITQGKRVVAELILPGPDIISDVVDLMMRYRGDVRDNIGFVSESAGLVSPERMRYALSLSCHTTDVRKRHRYGGVITSCGGL